MKSILFFFLLMVPVTGVAGETSVYYLYSDANSGEARMAKSGLHDEGEVVLRTLTDTVDGLERPRVFHSLHYSLAEDEIALASAGGSRNVSDLLTRYEIPTVFPGGNPGPDLVVLVPFEFTIWPSIFTIDKYSLETGVFTQVISGNFPALENYPYPSDPPIDRYRYRRSYFAMLEGLTYHHQTDTAYLGWAGKLYQVRAGSSSVTTPGSLVGALDFSVYGSGEVPDFSKLVIDEYQGQIFAAFGNRRSERKVRSQAVVFHESSYHLENGLRFKNDPFVAAPAVMEIDKASEANLLGRIRLDGTDAALVEMVRDGSPQPSLEDLAVDPLEKVLFAFDQSQKKLMKRVLHLADTSYVQNAAPAGTGRADFSWIVLPVNLVSSYTKIAVDARDKRLYFADGRQLKSVNYEGGDLKVHRMLPESVRDFVVVSPEVAVEPFLVASSFEVHGALPFSGDSRAAALSDDGRFLLMNGEGYDDLATAAPNQVKHALMQTIGGGFHSLGFARRGVSNGYGVIAIAVNGDGTRALVSSELTGAPVRREPALWSSTEGFTLSSELVNPLPFTVTAMSASGDEVVGSSAAGQAVFWNPAAGETPLPLPVGTTFSTAVDLSAAGDLVVGTANVGADVQAFRTGLTGDYEVLDEYPGRPDQAQVNACSPNGQWVAGQANYRVKVDFFDNQNPESRAVIWNAEGELIALPIPNEVPAAVTSVLNIGFASAVSDNGIVVGQTNGEPFIWHETTGTLLLADLLTDVYGHDLGSVSLQSATDLSADGFVVSGNLLENGSLRAYSATLPGFPLSYLLVNGGVSGLVDSDGDFVDDFTEVVFGTSPNDAGSRLAQPLVLEAQADGLSVLKLRLPAVGRAAGLAYEILVSDELSGPGVPLSEADFLAATSASGLSLAAGGRKFYRVRVARVE